MVDAERKEKLKSMLRDMFQFEHQDLDFGIFRIINFKRKEIEAFIDEDLFKEIDARSKEDNAMVDEVFDEIINFFSLYYDRGDFMSKRRYGKDNKYAVPYNGEEVFLYWANRDQYYIKTGEFFKNYSFKVGDFKVVFELLYDEVDVEKNNLKDVDKKFFVFSDAICDVKGNNVTVRLGYRGLLDSEEKQVKERAVKKRIDQDGVNTYNRDKILERLGENVPLTLEKKHVKQNGEESKKTELEWHLSLYSTKNTIDYFIHKDLKDFLCKELDFFIKNELLDIESNDKEDLERILKEISLFKSITAPIIDFLSEIEEFLKRLWTKKKFVVSTDYCITLDCIDEKHYPEILKSKGQLVEWKNLYGFDLEAEINRMGGVIPGQAKNRNNQEMSILKRAPSLAIDTKYYAPDFKYQILSEIEALDESITGILINSENYQAVNLLSEKYGNKVKCIYIDPPYNANSSKILYKNWFMHSSWLTMMENRITASKGLLADDGVYVVAIDENENEKLALMLDAIFGSKYDRTVVSVLHNPRGIQGRGFSYCHEYAHFVFPSGLELPFKQLEAAKEKPLMKTGSESERDTAKNCFYPIYVKNGEIVKLGDVPQPDFHPGAPQIEQGDGSLELWPICTEGKERKWRYKATSLQTCLEMVSVHTNKNGQNVIFLKKDEEAFKTLWVDARYNAAEYGSTLLKKMIPDAPFSFPKSIHTVKDALTIGMGGEGRWVVDFFAGSGTTGHATVRLNREDRGARKFILVEMGRYFDTVLKPRILKAIYSDNWQGGIPQDSDGMSKQIIKYQVLEQYEDSLNNVHFKQPNELVLNTPNYKARHMLEFETRESNVFLNLDALDDPFEYKLKIDTDGEFRDHNVDLVETFNYVAGINVDSISQVKDKAITYVIVRGRRGDRNTIVIWRNKPPGFDPESDKAFIVKNILKDVKDVEILVNGGSLVPGAKSIDEMFKTAMFSA